MSYCERTNSECTYTTLTLTSKKEKRRNLENKTVFFFLFPCLPPQKFRNKNRRIFFFSYRISAIAVCTYVRSPIFFFHFLFSFLFLFSFVFIFSLTSITWKRIVKIRSSLFNFSLLNISSLFYTILIHVIDVKENIKTKLDKNKNENKKWKKIWVIVRTYRQQ